MRLTIIGGFLALLLLLFSFTACDGGVEGTAETDSVTTVAEGTEGAEITTEPATEPVTELVTDTTTDAENVTTAAENATTLGAKNSDWVNAYKEYLESYPTDTYSVAKFSIDEVFHGNGNIPELLISTGDYHASGVLILSFMNGKLEDLGEYGGYGVCDYNTDDGLICNYFDNMDYSVYTVFKQTATRFERIVQFTEDRNGENPVYAKDGVTISKRQFMELLDEFYEVDFDDDLDDLYGDDDDYEDMYDNDMRTLQGAFEITPANVQRHLLSPYKDF